MPPRALARRYTGFSPEPIEREDRLPEEREAPSDVTDADLDEEISSESTDIRPAGSTVRRCVVCSTPLNSYNTSDLCGKPLFQLNPETNRTEPTAHGEAHQARFKKRPHPKRA